VTVQVQPTLFMLPGGNTCPASKTSLCTISVAFAPSLAGSFQSQLSVTDQVTGATGTAVLNGTGVGVPAVSVSTNSLVFPARAVNSPSLALPVTVTGTGQLTISSVSLSGVVDGNFTQTNNCSSVTVHGSCTINVTFAPTGTGMQGATLTIVSDAAGSRKTVMISGTAQ
jgi:hypothetical protein